MTALKPIRTETEHREALEELSRLMRTRAGTTKADRLEVLAMLIEAYEARIFPIDTPDPVSAIEFMMEQKGLKRRDLEPAIGSRGRVAEILNRKRPLTLAMIRALAPLLSIPAELLIQPYETDARGNED